MELCVRRGHSYRRRQRHHTIKRDPDTSRVDVKCEPGGRSRDQRRHFGSRSPDRCRVKTESDVSHAAGTARPVKKEEEERPPSPHRPATWDDDVSPEDLLQRHRFFGVEEHLRGAHDKEEEFPTTATIEEPVAARDVASAADVSCRETCHQSLLELVATLQTEVSEQLPWFELVLEFLPNFLRRRYQVRLPDDAPCPSEEEQSRNNEMFSVAAMEAARYPTLQSRTASHIIHRIDRDLPLLRKVERALQSFYRVAASTPTTTTSDAPHVLKIDDCDEDTEETSFPDLVLGRAGDIEPVFPLQMQISGSPAVVEGPPFPPTDAESEVPSSLAWTQLPMSPTRYPRLEGLLFGLQNIETKDDTFPAGLTGNRLRQYLKGKISSGGPMLRKGDDDGLILVPELRLPSEWTVDVWIKFPLRGLGPTRVLLAPKEAGAGAQVLFRDGAYIGCEAPAPASDVWVPSFARTQKRDRFSHLSNKNRHASWLPRNDFSPACRMSADCKRYVRNLKHFVGWHRFVITCDGTRQLFYVDGGFLGSTHRAVHAPVACIGKHQTCGLISVGNRLSLKNCAIGCIARLRIYNVKFSEVEVARRCGKVLSQPTQPLEDLSTVPGWEPHD